MEMSSDGPISDAAKGATKAFLEWSTEKITLFVRKLRDKKLIFIQDKRTIEIVKEQYDSGESKFYQKYIKNKEHLLNVRLGLTLRKLEGDEERLHNLRDKIFKKYKVEGLHIAEFVQNGILNRCIGIFIQELVSLEDFERKIEEILKNIEKYAIFVLAINKVPDIIKKVDTLITAHSPPIFVVAGVKSAAKVVQESIDKLKIILKDYDFEGVSSGEKEILFFKRKISD